MPELRELVQAAVERRARPPRQVEAYAEESRHTEVEALRGEVEGLTFAESRGVGVRVIRDGRLGYAWAADPSLDGGPPTVARARENAALAEPDEHNVLPAVRAPRRRCPSCSTRTAAVTPGGQGSARARPRARAVSRPTRACQAGPGAGRRRRRPRRDRLDGGRRRRVRAHRRWCVAVTLAVAGEETQTGFSFADRARVGRAGLGRRRRRGGRPRRPDARRRQAVDREASRWCSIRSRPRRLPRRAGGSAERGDRAEGPLAVRRAWSGERSAPRSFTLVDDGRRARRARLRARSTTRACPAAGPSCSAAAC